MSNCSWAVWFVSVLFAALAGAFAFRYFSLKRGLREMDRELLEIRRELSRNRILHLPLPDRDLERVLCSVNELLEEIRGKRLCYEKREREFQKLIENVSHDLRTPLTVILGYLKWSKKAEPSEIPDSLAVLERNAHAMERLVSQFYDFSRLQTEDYVPELTEVDVCRILRECIASHYLMLEEAQLELHISLPPHPLMVWANEETLERIFANLLQNAARYALGGLTVRAEESQEGEVRLSFENQAEGMTEDEVSHLFDRFYRNDSARRQGGSGLGLTVARSLAERIGGKLTAELLGAGKKAGRDNTENYPVSLRFCLVLSSRFAPDPLP